MTQKIEQSKLSGSTNGRPIKVTATATAGTLIHTATNVSGEIDSVFIYATNTSASAVVLTFELGGVTDPDDLLEVSIPAEGEGLQLVVPGLPYDGGVIIRAFAGTADVINLSGWVLTTS